MRPNLEIEQQTNKNLYSNQLMAHEVRIELQEPDYAASDRLGFIRKVYGIFTTQVLATTGFIAWAYMNPKVT